MVPFSLCRSSPFFMSRLSFMSKSQCLLYCFSFCFFYFLFFFWWIWTYDWIISNQIPHCCSNQVASLAFVIQALFMLFLPLPYRFLLILNHTGRRSPMQTTLLVLYLFTSFPTVLFKILRCFTRFSVMSCLIWIYCSVKFTKITDILFRGQFGYWIAFLAVAANLFCPQTFPGLFCI